MEGILREKLELNDEDWKSARRKFGLIKVSQIATADE